MLRQLLSARVAAVLVLFVAVGCGGAKDFTAEDFKTVTKDMPEAKVTETLGKPKETLEAMGTKRMFWEAKSGFYSISFKDGKVVEPMAHATKEDYMLMKGLMEMGAKMGNK